MTHSLNKEASQLLCDAMKCRMEDGDASAEIGGLQGQSIGSCRFWNRAIESMIASNDAGPCLSIKLNLYKLAKVGIHFNDI